jgi:hypothetical protein
MADTATKRIQKPRDVNYTLEVVDDLPDLDVQRRSPLEDQIEKIVAESRVHGKYVQIGDYANGSAASAAANVLRKRHGDKATVDGFEVRVRRADRDGQPRTGLFVKYDPEQIIDGERAEFDKRMKAREEKVAARRAEREAEQKTSKTPREKAQGPGQTSGTAEAVNKKTPENKQPAA